MTDLLDTVTNAIADRISDRIGRNLSEVLLVRDRESRQILNRTERLLRTLDAKINQNQGELMATLAQVFEALEAGSIAIIDKVNTEAAELVAALEAAKAGASPAELQTIIDRVNLLGSTVGDAVTALVPTVVTPEVPTPPVDEVPVPEPEPLPLPVVEVPVVIEPLPSEFNVPGAVSIEPADEPTPL